MSDFFSKIFDEIFNLNPKDAKRIIRIVITVMIAAVLGGLGHVLFNKTVKFFEEEKQKDSLAANQSAKVETLTKNTKLELKKVEILKTNSFPVVDFVFKNRDPINPQTIEEIIVDVIDIDVVRGPVLDFTYATNNGDLELFVKNNGHGFARKCRIEINNSFLNNYYDLGSRIFNGDIWKGDSLKILTFDKMRYTNSLASTDSAIQNINIDSLAVTWFYFGRADTMKAGTPMTIFSSLILTKDGFKIKKEPKKKKVKNADEIVNTRKIYCTIFNTENKNTNKNYLISRSIDANEIADLQILVGAERSVTAKLKFTFKTTNSEKIESQPIVININNTLKCKYHEKYKDGEVLKISDISKL